MTRWAGQRAVAARIIDREADYVLELKGNQGTLHADAALLFDERQGGFAGHEVGEPRSVEKNHGRLESRRVTATERIAGLRSIAKMESRCELPAEGKVEQETRYHLSSLPGEAEQIGRTVRSRWGVENGRHWVLDMVCRDDECRLRSRNAPANFAAIKPMAGNLLRRGKGGTACDPVATSQHGMRTSSTHSSPSDAVQSIALGLWVP